MQIQLPNQDTWLKGKKLSISKQLFNLTWSSKSLMGRQKGGGDGGDSKSSPTHQIVLRGSHYLCLLAASSSIVKQPYRFPFWLNESPWMVPLFTSSLIFHFISCVFIVFFFLSGLLFHLDLFSIPGPIYIHVYVYRYHLHSSSSSSTELCNTILIPHIITTTLALHHHLPFAHAN